MWFLARHLPLGRPWISVFCLRLEFALCCVSLALGSRTLVPSGWELGCTFVNFISTPGGYPLGRVVPLFWVRGGAPRVPSGGLTLFAPWVGSLGCAALSLTMRDLPRFAGRVHRVFATSTALPPHSGAVGETACRLGVPSKGPLPPVYNISPAR